MAAGLARQPVRVAEYLYSRPLKAKDLSTVGGSASGLVALSPMTLMRKEPK